MSKLSFDKLRQANIRRCVQVFHPIDRWSPTDWGCALAGETGEACNLIKKLRRLDTADAADDTVSRRDQIVASIGKELADVVIYADLLAVRLGLDLAGCIRQKFNEVSERRGSNIKL